MRSQNSRPSRGRNRGPRRDNRSRSNAPVARKPEPKGFWQKVVAFFSGGSAPATTRSRPERPSRGDESSSRRERGPLKVEVTSPKLYVGNLSFDASESDLTELFNGVGSVQSAEVVSHRQTHRSKGFAFVTMQTVDEAKRAVAELHDKEFMGRKLLVSGAKTSDVRDVSSPLHN